MLMVWTDDHENYFVQCANVGDSACFIKYVLRSHLIIYVYQILDLVKNPVYQISINIDESFTAQFLSWTVLMTSI